MIKLVWSPVPTEAQIAEWSAANPDFDLRVIDGHLCIERRSRENEVDEEDADEGNG